MTTDKTISQDAARKLLEACKHGMMMGAYANALLWNAGQILIQYGNADGKDHIVVMGNLLKEKGEIEYEAIAAAEGS